MHLLNHDQTFIGAEGKYFKEHSTKNYNKSTKHIAKQLKARCQYRDLIAMKKDETQKSK